MKITNAVLATAIPTAAPVVKGPIVALVLRGSTPPVASGREDGMINQMLDANKGRLNIKIGF